MQFSVKCVVGVELREVAGNPAASGPDALRGHVEDALGELGHRWIRQSRAELDTRRSQATFFLTVDAGDRRRALSKAWGVLSMAIHAAGGASSHRPFPSDAQWSVRLLDAQTISTPDEGRAAIA